MSLAVALAMVAFTAQAPTGPVLPVVVARVHVLREARHAARLFHPMPSVRVRGCERRSRLVVDCLAGFTFPAGDICTRSFRARFVSVADHRVRVVALGDPHC